MKTKKNLKLIGKENLLKSSFAFFEKRKPKSLLPGSISIIKGKEDMYAPDVERSFFLPIPNSIQVPVGQVSGLQFQMRISIKSLM
jgi:hypothetical protein